MRAETLVLGSHLHYFCLSKHYSHKNPVVPAQTTATVPLTALTTVPGTEQALDKSLSNERVTKRSW